MIDLSRKDRGDCPFVLDSDVESGASEGLLVYVAKQSPGLVHKGFHNTIATFGGGSDLDNVGDPATNPAIDNLCPNLSTCPESVVLTSPNVGIIHAYDVLYAFHPLTEAVYTDADCGRGCILEDSLPLPYRTLFR